jgi:hypothetical protein
MSPLAAKDKNRTLSCDSHLLNRRVAKIAKQNKDEFQN